MFDGKLEVRKASEGNRRRKDSQAPRNLYTCTTFLIQFSS